MVGLCPECATPVRATILAAVDPYANLLTPIPLRRLTSLGLVVWASAALGAALLTWGMRVSDAAGALAGVHFATDWMVTGALALVAASGLGALVIIRPHAGIPRWQVLAAAAGCAAYAPLLWVYWRIHAIGDAASPGPYFQSDFSDPARNWLRLAAGALILIILLGLRPNARLLAARSLLLREGRVDRQTMLAMSAVLIVGGLGDVLHLVGAALGPASDVRLYLVTAGTLVIAVSFMLLTLGLAGILIDVWRIWPVILEPAPSFRDLLGDDRVRAAPPAAPVSFPAAGAGDAARA